MTKPKPKKPAKKKPAPVESHIDEAFAVSMVQTALDAIGNIDSAIDEGDKYVARICITDAECALQQLLVHVIG